jgi:hypothetical protein
MVFLRTHLITVMIIGGINNLNSAFKQGARALEKLCINPPFASVF